jgi:nitrous oxide reductase accessory protein NosL
MMKFYFAPNEWGKYSLATKENITKILVRDYYSQKVIDAKKAFYVVNSDVYGPMGRELIPFKNQNEAKTFKKDHKATSIIAFDDISLKLILLLD